MRTFELVNKFIDELEEKNIQIEHLKGDELLLTFQQWSTENE